MFSAPVDGSANRSDGWRRLRETALAPPALPSVLVVIVFIFEAFSSLSLLIFISTLFLYVLFSCFHSGCCIVTLFSRWVCCSHVFYILFSFFFSSSYSLCVFIFYFPPCECGWLLSLDLFSDTWQMVVVMSEFVSRGVVAFFSTPRLSFAFHPAVSWSLSVFFFLSCITFLFFLRFPLFWDDWSFEQNRD